MPTKRREARRGRDFIIRARPMASSPAPRCLRRRVERVVGPHVLYTAFFRVSAIRVCQPEPVAFQRASVLGGKRSEIRMRALPVFGRPRGFSICFAVASPKSFGKTSRAGRARLKVSFFQTGLSRLVFSGLGLRFIPFYLTSIGFAQADNAPVERRGPQDTRKRAAVSPRPLDLKGV